MTPVRFAAWATVIARTGFEASALVIGKPMSAAMHLLAQNSILLFQIVDDIDLLPVDPIRKEQQQELKRLLGMSKGRRELSMVENRDVTIGDDDIRLAIAIDVTHRHTLRPRIRIRGRIPLFARKTARGELAIYTDATKPNDNRPSWPPMRAERLRSGI